MDATLDLEVRRLKQYAAFLTLAVLGCVTTLCYVIAERNHLGEIDVARINVRDKSGKLDLVISNAERMPPAIINGKAFNNGMRSPGMLFYNGKGDEDGGMGFTSHTEPNGTYRADGQLMFDQYNQDQEVGIVYDDNNGVRTAGLQVWDRGAMPIDQVMRKVEGLQGAQRKAIVKELSDAGELGTTRVFVGRLPDKSSEVVLSDGHGHPRLTIGVDESGSAEIKFLDENGKVVSSLPARSSPRR